MDKSNRDSSSKNMHTKQCQFEEMVSFMCEHPDLAKGYLKAPDAKTSSKHLWNRLTTSLNSAGPPMRDVSGWQKVWSDHKTHLKAKSRKNHSNFSGTGGGPPILCTITPLEERAIELLKMREALVGVRGAMKFGTKNAATTNTTMEPEGNGSDLGSEANNITSQIPFSSTSRTQTPTLQTENLSTNEASSPQHVVQSSRRQSPNLRSQYRRVPSDKTLLQKQVENQISYHKNYIAIMEKINNNIESIARYKRKEFDLKKNKYDLAKKKYEHKVKMDLENQRVKVAKLELKKQMFDLQNSI